jgi:hypothetical protein
MLTLVASDLKGKRRLGGMGAEWDLVIGRGGVIVRSVFADNFRYWIS